MLQSVGISMVFIIIAFALFFVLSFRGVNLFVVAITCVAFVSLATANGLASIFSTFMPTAANVFSAYFLMYTIGGAFGFCLMDSGLGAAMAYHLIKVFGEKRIPVVLFIVTCLLVAAGVQSYQYAILALALPILKKANLPKKIALAAMSAGGGSVVYGILAGMPTGLNVAPIPFLGTTTTAGLGMSLVCSAFAVAFIVGYLNLLVKNARKKGEVFSAHPNDVFADEETSVNLPSVWKGYFCVAFLIALSIVFQYILHIPAIQAVVYSQIVTIIVCFLLVGKARLPHPVLSCVKGFQGSVIPIIVISFIVGYGAVVQQTAAFQWVVGQILSLNMHPYLMTFVSVCLLSGLTTNGMGGVTLTMKAIGGTLINNPAVNLGAVHRISTIAGCTFDSLPHNGAIAFQLSVFNLSYKEGYFQQFMMSVVVNVLAGLIAVGIGILFY